MLSLNRLRREAENLDPDDGIKLTSRSEISVILENGQRIEVPHDVAKRIFGSAENLKRVHECFTGSESLELHSVRLSDEIWLLLEEIFAFTDEV